MYFASFGEEVLSAISSFASQASSALIDEIRIPLLTCLTIYFLIKGYLITYGRIDSPLSDFILTAGKILLVTNIFHSFATDLLNSLRAYESGRPLISVWLPVLKFSVLGLALTSLVKLIPSIAAAIVGGVALQAAGLGQMMNDTWRGTRDITGGFVNGLGKGSGSTDLQNYSRSHLMSRDGFGEHGTVGAAAFGAALGGTYRLGRTLLSVM